MVYNIGGTTSSPATAPTLAYTGPTTVNGSGGTFQVNANGQLGSTGTQGGVNLGNVTMEITAGFASARAITFSDSASTIVVDSGQTLSLSTPMAVTGVGAADQERPRHPGPGRRHFLAGLQHHDDARRHRAERHIAGRRL